MSPPDQDAIVVMFSRERVRQRKLNFIPKNFGPLNTMMERAGMSEMNIYHRTRDIILYYGLPFDQPPPEG